MGKTRQGKQKLNSYVIRRTEEDVRVGDYVLFKPSKPEESYYVAVVVERLKSRKVKVRWYYRPEDTISYERQYYHGSKELFLSDHYDIQSVDSIIGKCTVHYLKDYIKIDKVGSEDYYTRYNYNIADTENLTLNLDAIDQFCICDTCRLPYNPDKVRVECYHCKLRFHHTCTRTATYIALRLCYHCCDKCSIKRQRENSFLKDSNGHYSAVSPHLDANFSTMGPYWNQFLENSMQEKFMERSKKDVEQRKAMEERYKKACIAYTSIREIIKNKIIEAGEKNHVVTKLDVWEYVKRNAYRVIDDPVMVQVLEDVVTISHHLPENELTTISTDDLLAQLIPLEYSGRVRGVGWCVTKNSLQTVSTMSKISRLKKDVSDLINEIKELKSKGRNPCVQSRDSSHMDNFDMDHKVDDKPDHLDLALGEDLPEAKHACYLYLDPGRRYVGRGTLHNDVGDRILHGIPLEEGYVTVQFKVAEKSEYNAPLPIPCDEANLIGQAPGYFLAWPRKLVSTKLEAPPKTMNKKKRKHDMGHKKLEDKQKEKTLESIVDISSRQLGYPLPEDVCHDGVLEFVRLAIAFDRVTDIEVDMGVRYWNADPWKEHIHKENILEVLDAQWLSASSLVFYIRYLCEVFLSKNPELAAKFSFVSPHLVSPLVNDCDTSLTKCLLGHIDQDHLLLVPYNVSQHWILVAINTKTEMIYFMDPARKTNVVYYENVKALIETAMKNFRTYNRKVYTVTEFHNFKWTIVQCPKQTLDDGTFCGYYVGCFIEDILSLGDTNMNVNFSNSISFKSYHPDKMINFKKYWACYIYNRFLKEKLLLK
ncbi:uncharacterized protein LOC141721863 [Apium graveolens]|uniref:uncharacterized protein LOC141721863 n=1 Tax=Apium graveolens TaxID=4045 RepID=UPI003D79DEF1